MINQAKIKKTYEDVKARALQTFQDHPLETIAVIAMAATATAKLISSITEARNSKTWKREVSRRERQARY